MTMRAHSLLTTTLLLTLSAPTLGAPSAQGPPALATLIALEKAARGRVSAAPRVALARLAPDAVDGPDVAGLAELGQSPNYLRALGVLPETVKPFSKLARTIVFGGTVAPETKAAMGLRVAQTYGSPYVAAHLRRALARTERGRALLGAINDGREAALAAPDQHALRYAELLTRDVNGVTDAEFARVRSVYNDSQIVELTMVVCFFNYFTRLCEGLALPVEPEVLSEAPVTATARAARGIEPRVALISNEEIAATGAALEAARDPEKQKGSLGLGLANSQRAMFRVPDLAAAWRAYWTSVRQYENVTREIELQISFAVSNANGCRYCVVHQIVGLQRLGVSPAKLTAMMKDDTALTPRERVAVAYARKLTRDPLSTTDADYAALKAEFGEAGAVEVLLQTCAFAFMNRFTDNLRLPSEDEAVKIYEQVYGPGAYGSYRP
jgi:AhpD family alkylhydroperoxidase